MQDDFNSWQVDSNLSETTPAPVMPPMKWHKFLIYFLLWLGCIANVGNGLMQCTGGQYGADAARVYSYFDGLQALDVFFGVLSIALGVLQIVARFKLAHFKANGPTLLKASYLCAAAYNLLYPIIASGVTGLELTELLNIGTVIGNIAMVALNHTYYTKRAHLFVN